VRRWNGRHRALGAPAALLLLAIAPTDAAASPGDMNDVRDGVGRDPIPGDPTIEKPVTEALPHPRFGERGQLVLSADLELRIGARWSDGDDPRSSFHFAVSPSFDAFVADDFTLGAFASYGTTTSRAFGPDGSLGDYTSTTGALGGRIGFNAPLGRWLSWWPRFSLAWSQSSSVATIVTPAAGATQTTRGGYDYTQSGLYIYLQAPLLVHPAPHWFLGVGPTLYQDLSRGFADSPRTNNRTTIGFAYVVGGYF
jgi:hypothetical protein